MKYALITVYHPTEEVRQNIRAIAEQVDLAIVCDNSPEPNRGLLEPLIAAKGVRYVFFGKNLGLSQAFNRVLLDPGYLWQEDDYLFFFDQDSSIAERHVETLITVYERARGVCDIGCLGPAYFNTSSGIVELPRAKRLVSEKTYAVSSIITSSMLCRYGDLREIGFWNGDVFLDMADWDLCWRLQMSGKVCCLTEAVILRHSVGLGEKRIGPLRLRVGAPVREYYQIRDCLYLLRKRYTPMKYRVRFLAMILVRSPLHILFLNNRRERLRCMIKGISDYLGGKHGEYPVQASSAEKSAV